MSDGTERISRRGILQHLGVGLAAGSVAGRAGASSRLGGNDRYIVGTKPGFSASAVTSKADAVKRELDFGSRGKAVAGRFSEAAAQALENRPDVRYVERDGLVEALGESLPWGVDRVDADVAHDDGATGDGAHIAIIDSGIDSDHPDLQGNLGAGKAFVRCGTHPDDSDCSTTNGNSCIEPWDDDNDHGSHCAGIADAIDNETGVVGVATNATLHAVKVLGCSGYGNYSDVASAITYVADQGWDVASMSLGASSGSSAIYDAVQYATQRDVLLVAAAGNAGPCQDCVKYPAAYSEVIAVSATDSDDNLASFSSTGIEVEIAAPGASIRSTIPGGTVYKSGTSMATPHVAGAAGLLVANGYTATEARDRLNSTAEDIGLSSTEQGSGLLDVDAALDDTQTSEFTMQTDQPTNVTTDQATLNGYLESLDGADSAGCYFKLWEKGSQSSTSTFVGLDSLDSTGSYSEKATDLASGTTYVYAARGEASDGAWKDGGTVEFTTESTATLAVSTAGTTNLGTTTVTLNGSLDDLGGASSAECYFQYRQSGGSTWNTTTSTPRTSTGSFSADVTALESDTSYEFRAVVDASDGDSATSSATSFSTDQEDTTVVVSTGSISSVSSSAATLSGSVTDLGGASSAECYFQYRQSGADSWATTPGQTLDSTGSFTEDLSDLSSGTDYEFRAIADASDGDSDTGSTVSFTTDSQDTSVVVSTGSISSVSESSATLAGSLTDLGGATSAECYFQYRQRGTATWETTTSQTLSSTGSFSETLSGLSTGTDYEFRAVADASDGDSDTGSAVAFSTERESSGGLTVETGSVEQTWLRATLNGSVSNLGGASSATVYFEYWEKGAKSSTLETTDTQTRRSTGAFSENFYDSYGTTYVYQAVAESSDGQVDTGSQVEFTG